MALSSYTEKLRDSRLIGSVDGDFFQIVHFLGVGVVRGTDVYCEHGCFRTQSHPQVPLIWEIGSYINNLVPVSLLIPTHLIWETFILMIGEIIKGHSFVCPPNVTELLK